MYRRIDHMALHVADLARSKDFYATHFGFETYYEHATPMGFEIAYLRLGDSVLELVGRPDSNVDGFHFCMEADDFDAAFAALEAAGVEVAQAAHPTQARVERETGWRRAVFKGPDGELVEIRG